MDQRARFALVTVLLVGCIAALAAPAAAAEGVVNINTASADQLALLPRVGTVVAQRIVAFRDQNGKFESLEDLMLVEGIGARTFELLEPHVSLTGETTLEEKVSASTRSGDQS